MSDCSNISKIGVIVAGLVCFACICYCCQQRHCGCCFVCSSFFYVAYVIVIVRVAFPVFLLFHQVYAVMLPVLLSLIYYCVANVAVLM